MKLRDWRKNRRKLTMAQAVDVLGLSQSSISRIERGEQWPDKDTMQQIMDRTDGEVTPNDFMLESTSPPDVQESAA